MSKTSRTTTGPRHGRRLPAALAALGLVGLAAAAGFALAAPATGQSERAAGAVSQGVLVQPDGPSFTWNDGRGTRTAWLATDEVTVFLRRGTLAGKVGARLLRKANDGQEVSGTVRRQGTSQVTVPVAPLAGETPAVALRRVRAALLADPAVTNVGAVFYEGLRASSARLIGTGELIVRFRAALTASRRRALLADLGLLHLRDFPFAEGAVLVKAAAPLDVFAAARALHDSGQVLFALPSFYRVRAERAVPDDPYFLEQWHLRNTGRDGTLAGVDLDVLQVWGRLRGSQQVIAIADDGVQVVHPDLAANVFPDTDTTGSFDWVDGDRDPSPAVPEDDHGTACAGVAAARGFNGIGVSGVAPAASLIGYRFLDVDNDANEAEVLANVRDGAIDNRDVVDVVNSSWGPTDDRHLEAPGPLAAAALADGIAHGRGGKGTIYVWAAGNGRAEHDNVNFDGYANSRFTIPVGAVTARGTVASYSEDGAPLRVCAPSSGSLHGIVTTDRTGADGYNVAPSPRGDYTSGFGGTSAAAPQVSGVVALMLQANPELGWRDVQQILMTTARKNDPSNAGWTTNAAGYHINHSYGFGLVDAAAAVRAARTWMPVGPEESVEGSVEVDLAIPDGSTTGSSSTIRLGADLPAVRIEYVEVYFTAQHPYWSDLEVTLTAPSGTRSVLATACTTAGAVDPAGNDYSDWRFGTARDLGESSRGTWTLRVRDLEQGDGGTFIRWRLKVHGTPLPVDDEAPLTRVETPVRLWWNTPPRLRLTAVDLGSNVLRTEYRVDGEADGPYDAGTTVRLEAPGRTHANDGRHVVWYRSIDNAEPPNLEEVQSQAVNIDTRRPLTAAPRAAVVARGGTARLFYRVTDPGFSAGEATVRIQVRRADGNVVRSLLLRAQPTGTLRSARLRCALPRGTYRFIVYATDAAGNVQARAGSNRLTVR